MKKVVMLVSLMLSFQVFAAPTVSPESSDEITMEDLQEEFLKEVDTLVVEEEDVNFLDQEIEKKAVAAGKQQTSETKAAAKTPATSTIKK